MSIITLIILIIMVITPVVSVVAVLLNYAEMKSALSWPQVTGQVTAVRLLQSGQQYQPELDVAYTVANQPYSSRQHPSSQTGQSKGSKTWAREFSLQFKPGTAVSLYYDPKRPKRATLNPHQMRASNPRWQLTSGLMILLSIAMHILGVRGIMGSYLNLTGSSIPLIIAITTIVSLLLGAALGLLVQESRQPSP